MVQQGTPEQYFGLPVTESRVILGEPVPIIQARVTEPVEIRQAQLQTDNTPLILAICFLGAVSIGLVIVLGLHVLFGK